MEKHDEIVDISVVENVIDSPSLVPEDNGEKVSQIAGAAMHALAKDFYQTDEDLGAEEPVR
jgi:hypothetical protein